MAYGNHIGYRSVKHLVADASHRFGDNADMTRSMKFPNTLAAHMRRAGVNDPALASAVGTSKQQIGKLRLGTRQLTKAWAERLAPHLHTTWVALMDAPATGFADASDSTGFTPAPEPPLDMDEIRATIQEAVAAAVGELRLQMTQGDIYRAARAVERDMEKLGELPRFPETLDLRVSELVSKLQSKWQLAKASL